MKIMCLLWSKMKPNYFDIDQDYLTLTRSYSKLLNTLDIDLVTSYSTIHMYSGSISITYGRGLLKSGTFHLIWPTWPWPWPLNCLVKFQTITWYSNPSFPGIAAPCLPYMWIYTCLYIYLYNIVIMNSYHDFICFPFLSWLADISISGVAGRRLTPCDYLCNVILCICFTV